MLQRISRDNNRHDPHVHSFLSFVNVDRLHGPVLSRLVRHFSLHHLENKQHVAGLDGIARLDEHLPDISRNLREDLFCHASNLENAALGAKGVDLAPLRLSL